MQTNKHSERTKLDIYILIVMYVCVKIWCFNTWNSFLQCFDSVDRRVVFCGWVALKRSWMCDRQPMNSVFIEILSFIGNRKGICL